jgi:hypothetical protein
MGGCGILLLDFMRSEALGCCESIEDGRNHWVAMS